MNILVNISHLFLWESCLVIKQHNSFFKVKTLHASKPLELVHTNVFGLMQTKSIKDFTYFVIYIDDYLRFTTIYFLKHKSKVFQAYKVMPRIKQIIKLRFYTPTMENTYKKNLIIFFCSIWNNTIFYTPKNNGISKKRIEFY